MSTNPDYLKNRFIENAVVNQLETTVRQLARLTTEESAKRYAATREERRTLALDLVSAAETMAQRLADAPTKRAPRKRELPPIQPPPLPTPPEEVIA